MGKKKISTDTIIRDEIYPIIENAMNTRESYYKRNMERFIQYNHTQLYDYAPIDRIYWKKSDTNNYFNALAIKEADILKIIKRLYYYYDDEKQACKDPFSISQLMVVRYYMRKNKDNETELAAMYLAFSGKFYASCHYKWFRSFTPDRRVMDYVINHMLTGKYDLITEKSVFGAIRKLVRTWISTYKNQLSDDKLNDMDVVYVIHQLFERIYSFLRNIAKLYFQAYQEKKYLNRESDNYDSDSGNFRIAGNNSTQAAIITEKTVNYMVTTSVSLSRCVAASAKGVEPTEVKAIFENILNDSNKLLELRDVINILIVDFMRNYPDEKDIPSNIKFIDHSAKAKPNTKDKDLIRLKTIVTSWLRTSSRYRSIRTPNTLNNYYKAIILYIVLCVNEANKGD